MLELTGLSFYLNPTVVVTVPDLHMPESLA
jgi:hypothetical protein